jgi:hypothetical protein
VTAPSAEQVHSFVADLEELWPNLGDGGVRKAAYRGG